MTGSYILQNYNDGMDDFSSLISYAGGYLGTPVIFAGGRSGMFNSSDYDVATFDQYDDKFRYGNGNLVYNIDSGEWTFDNVVDFHNTNSGEDLLINDYGLESGLTSTNGHIALGNEGIDQSLDFVSFGGYVPTSISPTDSYFAANGGNVGIGTATPNTTLDVAGTISGSALTVSGLRSCDTIDTDNTGVTACGTDDTSDIRLKKNIENMSGGALDFLTNIRTVSYEWNDDMLRLHPNASDDGRMIGFIAQDFADQYPELVSHDADGYLGIKYTHVAPLLVEGLKELNSKVDSLSGSLRPLPGNTDTVSALQKSMLSFSQRLGTLEEKVDGMGGSTLPQATAMPDHLTASTLELEKTLMVGGDARVTGDLYLDGSLITSDLSLTGLLNVDGSVSTTFLQAKDGAIQGTLNIGDTLTIGGASLRFSSGAIALDDLLVEKSLFVMGDVTITGMTHLNDVFVSGNEFVGGQFTMSGQQSGEVEIPEGATGSSIEFGSIWSEAPLVSVTPDAPVLFAVTGRTSVGFVIKLAAPATETIHFTWLAIGSEGVSTQHTEAHDNDDTVSTQSSSVSPQASSADSGSSVTIESSSMDSSSSLEVESSSDISSVSSSLDSSSSASSESSFSDAMSSVETSSDSLQEISSSSDGL